jgi:hypothetical protein
MHTGPIPFLSAILLLLLTWPALPAGAQADPAALPSAGRWRLRIP